MSDYNRITFGPITFHITTVLKRLQTCQCRLEACVVVAGDLVLGVVLSGVCVLVILTGSAHQGPLQHLRVRSATVELIPATPGGWVGTGATRFTTKESKICLLLFSMPPFSVMTPSIFLNNNNPELPLL